MEKSTDYLGPFFEPKGIVIVGATRTPGFGYAIPLMLIKQGWGDKLRLVSLKGEELHGLRVYNHIKDIPDPADLAIIITPARAVPDVIKELAQKGVHNAIIECAGFAEIGEDGRKLQELTKKTAEEHGVRLIGPNCVGVVNTNNKFTSVEIIDEALKPGNLGIIAQSGAFGNVLLDGLYEKGLAVSKAVTLGNRIDINESDILEYFHRDDLTEVIMMYIEGTADGPRLKKTLEKVTKDKPVLVLKSGRTKAGSAATASHTGSMSGEDVVYDGLFRQSGAIRAESLEQLVDYARVFTTQNKPTGNRLGVVTTSGSLGALAADEAIKNGLALPSLTKQTVEKVMEASPSWMNVKNPLDVGPSGMYDTALAAMMTDPNIDMVLAITIIPYSVIKMLRPQGITVSDLFGDMKKIKALAPQKPFALIAVGNSEFVNQMQEQAGEKTPVFTSPEHAVKAFSALYKSSIYL